MSESPVYATAKEVSQILPISEGHLAKLRSQRKGPPFHRPPGMRRVFYEVAALRRWIEAGACGTDHTNHQAA